MTAHARLIDPTADEVRRGYAPPGVRFHRYALFVVGFAAAVASVLFVASWVTSAFERPRRDARAAPAFVAPADAQSEVGGPEPRLQPSPGHETVPWQDVERMQHEQWGRLSALGWERDAATGRAVVPDAIVERVGAQIAAARQPKAATQPAPLGSPADPRGRPGDAGKGDARP